MKYAAINKLGIRLFFQGIRLLKHKLCKMLKINRSDKWIGKLKKMIIYFISLIQGQQSLCRCKLLFGIVSNIM